MICCSRAASSCSAARLAPLLGELALDLGQAQLGAGPWRSQVTNSPAPRRAPAARHPGERPGRRRLPGLQNLLEERPPVAGQRLREMLGHPPADQGQAVPAVLPGRRGVDEVDQAPGPVPDGGEQGGTPRQHVEDRLHAGQPRLHGSPGGTAGRASR